jgi:glycosyltransferase 2 family protein
MTHTALRSRAAASRSARGHLLRQAAGYLIAVACLVWVFHDFHVERLAAQVATINWWWIAVAVVADTVSYMAQGYRWKLLLRPLGVCTTLQATQAVYAGLFTNEILPLRAGELVRAFLVARRLGARILTVLPSMAVERLFDGVWLGIGMGLTAAFVRLPADLADAADALGVVVIVATLLFVWLVLRTPRPAPSARERPAPRLLRRLSGRVGELAGGVRAIGISGGLLLSLAASSLILVFQIFSFWFVMESCHLGLSLWVGAAVFMILHLGTALPNAPSNVGSYQFFTVLGLALFGVDKATATGFSVVAFIILTLPLWALGLAAVTGTGMRLSDIRAHIAVAMRGGAVEEGERPS